jgi:VanZ family protein
VALAAVLVASFYGVTDEFHQSFVPNRQSDARDVLADTAGATVAAAACALWSLANGPGRRSRSV